MHHDEASFPGSDPLSGARIREAADVVQHADPRLEGPVEHLGSGRVDRERHLVRFERTHDRLESADLLVRVDERGVGVARSGA